MAYPIERDGKWYACYKDHVGRRKRKVTLATTKRECQRIADELERQGWRQRHGLDDVPAECTWTLKEACAWWLNERCPEPSISRERSRLETHVYEHSLGRMHLGMID